MNTQRCTGCGQTPLRLTGGDHGFWTCDTADCPGNIAGKVQPEHR